MHPPTEIEFTIDLFPGTIPISKVLYHMTPMELVKLIVKLQELLDKVHLSVPPWGVLCYLSQRKMEVLIYS